MVLRIFTNAAGTPSPDLQIYTATLAPPLPRSASSSKSHHWRKRRYGGRTTTPDLAPSQPPSELHHRPFFKLVPSPLQIGLNHRCRRLPFHPRLANPPPLLLSQVLSMMAVAGWRPPESNREVLTVNTISDEKCIPGIVCLLQSSPLLRAFHIEGNCCDKNCIFHEVIFPDGIPESCLSMFTLEREFAQLTKVTMKSFANPDLPGEPMLRLVQLLLLRAVELETMEIKFGDFSYTLKDYVNIIEALISFTRSSRDAVVTIKDALGAIIRDVT